MAIGKLQIPHQPEFTASVRWINTNHDKELIGTLEPYLTGVSENRALEKKRKNIGKSIPVYLKLPFGVYSMAFAADEAHALATPAGWGDRANTFSWMCVPGIYMHVINIISII